MSKNYINNFDFDLQCPNCHGTFKVSSNNVGSSINCQYCHQKIILQDSGFFDGIQEVFLFFEVYSLYQLYLLLQELLFYLIYSHFSPLFP